MGVKFTNNAYTTLASSISAGATSFSVVSAAGFPTLGAGEWTYVSLTDEVVKVTAISGNTFTCDAVVGGHSSGIVVELRMTAELLEDNAIIATNSIGANELNVVGNGTAGQYLGSDADGTFTWTSISSDPSMGGDLSGTASNAQIVANAITDAEVADNALSGNKIDGGTISNFASTGIDDNANALAMTIDSSEKVGIGTTTPGSYEAEASQLVVGTTSGNNGITIASGNANTGNIYFADGTITNQKYRGFISFSHSTEHMRFATGTNTRMTIDNTGNVGIGATSPNDKLEISSGGIRLTRPNGITWNGTNEKIYTSDGTEGTAGSIICRTGGFIRMHINALSGNVGIGTTTPSGKLHVKSAGASTTPFRIERSGGSGDEVKVAMQGDNRPFLQMYQHGTEKIRFDVGSGSFITNNFGVAVTPSYTFHVKKWIDNNYLVEFENRGTTNPKVLQLRLSSGSVGLVDGHNARYLNCGDVAATRCVIFGDGDIQNHDNSYGSTSDEKLKQDISDSSSQWEDVKALGKIVRKFRFKTDVEANPDARYLLGFVAQEVERISPALVRDNPDMEEVEVPSVDDDGNPKVDEEGNSVMETIHQETGTTTKAVKYSIAYMKAFKALGEAMERIETLEQDVAILKGA